MKKNLMWILLFSCMANAFAIGDYKKGESVFVWAISGLKVRMEASAQSKVIQTLDYGTMVEITDDNLKQVAFGLKVPKVDSIKSNLTLNGFWVRIKFKNTEGYVFDAFLSKMPPFKKHKAHYFEQEDVYLERVFGKPKHKTYTTITNKIAFKNDDFVYKNGIVREEVYGDGCFDHSFEIPNLSLAEAYLFLKVIFFSSDSDEGEMKLIKVSKDGYLFNEVGACGLRGFRIEKDKAVIFSSDCT
jgi:Bacterial SH3 domain